MADDSKTPKKKATKKATKKKATKKKVVITEEAQEVAQSSDAQPLAGIASLAHWSFLIGGLPSLVIPVVLLVTTGKKDAFVRDNAKEALNLLLFIIICSVVFGILCATVVFVCIGVPLFIALGLYVLIFSIVAAIQTMSSSMVTPVYRYPWIFRLIK
jgi:uncharacterized Tic20 family protein